MEKLSKHFNRSEFRCRGENCCGGSSPIQERLIQALEEYRFLLNRENHELEVRIEVRSGFRCVMHNREVGGAKDSRHMSGEAADIVVCGMEQSKALEILRWVGRFQEGGIGVYDSFVHVDVRRDGPARW